MSCADGACVFERRSAVDVAIFFHVAFVARYCNDDVIANNFPQLSHPAPHLGETFPVRNVVDK